MMLIKYSISRVGKKLKTQSLNPPVAACGVKRNKPDPDNNGLFANLKANGEFQKILDVASVIFHSTSTVDETTI